MIDAMQRMRKAEKAGFILIGSATRQGTRRALIARGLSDDGYTLNDRGRKALDALER